MLSHKVFIAALLFLTSQAFAYDFKASTGLVWSFDIPKGWHVIDSPEGIAEGVHIRLASSPSANWDNPIPPAGHAVIVIGFYGGDAEITKPSLVQKAPEHVTMQAHVLTSNSRNLIIDGRVVPLTTITNDANVMDVTEATNTITTSLHQVKP